MNPTKQTEPVIAGESSISRLNVAIAAGLGVDEPERISSLVLRLRPGAAPQMEITRHVDTDGGLLPVRQLAHLVVSAAEPTVPESVDNTVLTDSAAHRQPTPSTSRRQSPRNDDPRNPETVMKVIDDIIRFAYAQRLKPEHLRRIFNAGVVAAKAFNVESFDDSVRAEVGEPLADPKLRLRKNPPSDQLITVQVEIDGTLGIRHWNGDQWDSWAGNCDLKTAMSRALPDAIGAALFAAKSGKKAFEDQSGEKVTV